MTQQITGAAFKTMLINAAAAIENHKQEINELNVFPVPDGDTGTNMSLTISAGAKALEAITPSSIGHAAEVTASALLRGARGNSGVILSLLFRGFARSLKDFDTANASSFAVALAAGVDSAYKAVMKPTEGTILTVSRLAAAGAVSVAEVEPDVEIMFEQALAAGHIALADTINQNPVLKKAGVIDAGAKGYLYILDGMLKALRGEMIERKTTEDEPEGKADFASFSTEDIKFAYCTEFIAERKYKADTNRLRDFLDLRGDSIVVVDDEEIIKVHVHTNEPGIVLTEALTYGPLLTVKIENMREQHTETIASSAAAAPAPSAPPKPPEPEKAYGTVAVCAGEGLEAVFRDLGTDNIITGGQTMNPSTEEILEKINATNAQTVFVLPNNKNIIWAAEQCIQLTEKRVVVIPSRSIPQGIAAMLALDDSQNAEEITECMRDAARRVHTALITLAARDSVFDGHEIREGEYLALVEDALAASGSDFNAIITAVAAAIREFEPEFITIFPGEGVGGEDADSVAQKLTELSPDAETTVIQGGQPVYHYIISAE